MLDLGRRSCTSCITFLRSLLIQTHQIEHIKAANNGVYVGLVVHNINSHMNTSMATTEGCMGAAVDDVEGRAAQMRA